MKFIAMMAAMLLGGGALAQSWPQKPVRFIVPFPPGGATDISARLLGEKLTQIWGQTVVIENRGGAGGGVGAAEAARAAPDGYTLFFPSGSVVTANQHIYAKLNYDPEKDFVPVTNVVSGPQVLVVPAGSAYKSVGALVDAAKASPGRLTFGHAGIVSPTGTPREIIAKVYQDTKKALDTTEIKARFYAQGLAPVGNSPEEFAAAMKAETALWANVVKERNIHVQ